MSSIWMGIAPVSREMRVLAIAGSGETILKASLRRPPTYLRALPLPLEAMALWQGESLRVALAAEERGGEAALSVYEGIPVDDRWPLFTVDRVAPPAHICRRHLALEGLGGFYDLRQLLLFGVRR
jgi:hypothetical protein